MNGAILMSDELLNAEWTGDESMTANGMSRPFGPPSSNAMRCLFAALFMVSAVVPAGAGDSEVGTRYALLIGVSRYHPDRFADLSGAEPDVNEMSRVLTSGGYVPENVTLMTNTSGATDPRKLPTASVIRKQLRRLAKVRGTNDSIIVGLAGHGVQPRGGKYYFCPMDANLAETKSLISIDEIYEAMD